MNSPIRDPETGALVGEAPMPVGALPSIPPPNMWVASWILNWITWTLREDDRRRQQNPPPPAPPPMPGLADMVSLKPELGDYANRLAAAGVTPAKY